MQVSLLTPQGKPWGLDLKSFLKQISYHMGRFVRHTTSTLLKYLEYAHKEFSNGRFFTLYDFYTKEELEKFKRGKKEYKALTSAHL